MNHIVASNAETKRGQPEVNPGSTWGQPGVNLGSTWGQPGVHLGSTCTALPCADADEPRHTALLHLPSFHVDRAQRLDGRPLGVVARVHALPVRPGVVDLPVSVWSWSFHPPRYHSMWVGPGSLTSARSVVTSPTATPLYVGAVSLTAPRQYGHYTSHITHHDTTERGLVGESFHFICPCPAGGSLPH